MSGKKQINDVSLRANNELVAYEPNTLKTTHGKGESSIRNTVLGGNETEGVFSKDIATKFGGLKFSLACTDDNVALVDRWKDDDNNNVFEVIGGDVAYNRIFSKAAVTNDPEFDFSTEGAVEIEVKSNPAQ